MRKLRPRGSFGSIVPHSALHLHMGWQFWIDRGGTFTDVVGKSPSGDLQTEKLLSENPEHYPDSAIEGMRRLLQVADDEPFPHARVDTIRMGTTVATNALLERRGAKTLLAITKGFGDALFIGTQHRPHIFELKVSRPTPLYTQVLEIPERLFADGKVETPLDTDNTHSGLKDAFDAGYRSVAIALIHADRHPRHELAVAQIARDIGFTQVSTSHDTVPLMRLVSRGDTTVADAYLSPELRRYVEQVTERVENAPLYFMQSNGGLVDARRFQGKDAVLSGPAGGVVGMAETAKAAGFDRLIGFDMGGTSTDVSHYAGTYERSIDNMVAGVRIRAPMMDIHTVAAGGGSECLFDGLRFRVGPESAGAVPGPAAYRRGGPLTITDCNVLLGRIQPHHFPATFGTQGDQRLDASVVHRLFEDLAVQVSTTHYGKMSIEHLAEGFIALAVEDMANAIKTISVQKGHDLSRYALVSFGGAGGQHACRIADALGIGQILIHPLSGLLSAFGMGLAKLRVLKQQTIAIPLAEEQFHQIEKHLDKIQEQAKQALSDQLSSEASLDVTAQLHLRYEGSDTTITVPRQLSDARDAFEAEHLRLFGFVLNGKPIVAETVSAEAVSRDPQNERHSASPSTREDGSTSKENINLWVRDKWQSVPVFERALLAPEQAVEGPALIVESHTTTVVEPGWQARTMDAGELLITRVEARARNTAIAVEADPIKVEIFNSLFMSIAEQMGAVLQKTAHSVNIKERLDFSCAVFDNKGDLLANAPHMPVHLGSMGESVRAILEQHDQTMSPGDMFATNAPYNGGTHLPDVTVIAPVYTADSQKRVFFIAARGHHADIGGLTPGSMPPDSLTIEDEGVVLDGLLMIRCGIFLEDELTRALSSGSCPARNPSQNIADLRAQAAACAKGIAELQSAVEHYGQDGVLAYAEHVKNNAEEAVRRVISTLDNGSCVAPMDDGGEVHVRISVDSQSRTATVDFSGTSAQRESNYNAPSAVTKAAVLYVFRTLVGDDIPMNEGCLRPLEIILPTGSMLNPTHPAAVVAGNVETSQIVCDALYGALGQLAASQGTMNNLTFGNDEYQYYETVCGGMGAGPGFSGADAIQTHMTNSRLTDPEVLEWRYPVLVESFGIRENSGGGGQFRGGDGVVRRIRFREPMSVSILAGRRTTSPFGILGGQNGLSGITTIDHQDGTQTKLKFAGSIEATTGDVIVMSTPGGGGYGSQDAT